ncbi:MAG: T9SS type A sorting domain-containing protein [Chitinophagales bacterium]|nr:T9SS type A sorting domain-containing protein [Chitinophagales bacterium]
MKKQLFLIFSVLSFVSLDIKAQDTYHTATWLLDGTNIYPSVGTTAPIGPDYGCAVTNKRPYWGMLAACAPAETNSILDGTIFEYSSSNPIILDTVSMVIWGPFDDTADIFNQLTTSSIYTCINFYFDVRYTYNHINLSLKSGKIYYAVIMSSDSVESILIEYFPILQPVSYVDSSHCSICKGHVTYLPQRICIVTVDSATGKNKIMWTPEDSAVQAYIIYRQGSAAGKFDSIGRVEFNEPKEFIDEASNPLEKSYTYILGTVDSCERIQADYTSPKNTTIHLTSSVGLNGEVNLVWNPYEGYYSNTSQYYSTYYIFRNVNYGPYQIIDSIASNTSTYTDLTPPSGPLNYRIGIHVPTCYADQGIFTYSNRSSTTSTGIWEGSLPDDVKLFPNPAHSLFNLELGKLKGKVESIRLLSLSGDVIIPSFIPLSDNLNIDITRLAKGIYMLEINSNGIIYRMKAAVM